MSRTFKKHQGPNTFTTFYGGAAYGPSVQFENAQAAADVLASVMRGDAYECEDTESGILYTEPYLRPLLVDRQWFYYENGEHPNG